MQKLNIICKNTPKWLQNKICAKIKIVLKLSNLIMVTMLFTWKIPSFFLLSMIRWLKCFKINKREYEGKEIQGPNLQWTPKWPNAKNQTRILTLNAIDEGNSQNKKLKTLYFKLYGSYTYELVIEKEKKEWSNAMVMIVQMKTNYVMEWTGMTILECDTCPYLIVLNPRKRIAMVFIISGKKSIRYEETLKFCPSKYRDIIQRWNAMRYSLEENELNKSPWESSRQNLLWHNWKFLIMEQPFQL